MKNLAHISSSGEFFRPLDGLRGIAILSVVALHSLYFNPANLIQKYLFALARGGGMGVKIFFVLSGFLISHSIFRRPEEYDVRKYAWRRFAKVGPPFLLSLAIFSVVVYFWKHPAHLLLSILANLTTVAQVYAELANINGVYWSLFVEIHFYILLPLIFFGLRRLSRHPEIWTFLLFLIVPAAVRMFTYLPESTNIDRWKFQVDEFPRALDNFAPGILFSILYSKKKPLLIKLAPMATSIGAALLVVAAIAYAIRDANIPAPDTTVSIAAFETFRFLPEAATFCLLFSIFLRSTNPIVAFLCFPPLEYIGVISYEWYLFHLPPSQVAREIIGHSTGSLSRYLGQTLAPALGTLLFSAFLYHKFSAPIMHFIKQRCDRDRAKAPAARELST